MLPEWITGPTLASRLREARDCQASGASMHAAAERMAERFSDLQVRTYLSMIGDWVEAGKIPAFAGRKGRKRGARNLLPLERDAGTRITTTTKEGIR